MWGYVVFMVWFELGRLSAALMFATAIIVRVRGATGRFAFGAFAFGVTGLFPTVFFYAQSDDLWRTMCDAGEGLGPWLDIANAVMLVAAASTLFALRRRPPA